jgi:hypothetical protein
MKTFSLATLLGSCLLLGACAAPSSGEDPVSSSHELVVVTADDTRDLAPSARLSEPFVDGVVYELDASKGPIDFGRIDLVDERGERVSMDTVVQTMAAEQGVDAASFQRRTFEIGKSAGDLAASRGGQDDAAPSATPQLAMICYYRFCSGNVCWYYPADCP